MSVDLSGLVLGPCMEAWAKPVIVTPVRSRPLAAPYPARGVWIVENINIPMDDGGTFSSKNIKLGIKLDEFTVSPEQYDEVKVRVCDLPLGYVIDELDPNAYVSFVIDNEQSDGQGGSQLILKRKSR